MDKLTQELGGRAGGNILDVATGRGGFIPYIKEIFPRHESIIGIDISNQNVEHARRIFNVSPNIAFAVMDASRLGLKNQSMDTVVISNSLHHLSHLDLALEEMKRALKTDGMLLIFEMYRDNQSERQMSHVLAHHWWAEIDRLNGQVHGETLTKKEIEEIGRQLDLADLDFIEYDDPEPVSPAEIDRIIRTCEDYLIKARGMVGENGLTARGNAIVERIKTLGFAWASLLCVVGRK